jgi:DNA-binding NarL/FixJ family response regulator
VSNDFSPIRILSVDDHPIIAQVVAGLVATRADMNLIAQAANGYVGIHRCGKSLARAFQLWISDRARSGHLLYRNAFREAAVQRFL